MIIFAWAKNKAMIIKICEIGNVREIASIEKLPIDMYDLNFCKDHPSSVYMHSSDTGMLPDYAVNPLKNRTVDVKPNWQVRIGTFEDEMPQNIITRVYNFNLRGIQLNGNDTPTMCENLKLTLVPDLCPELLIIKRIAVNKPGDIEVYRRYEQVVDYFLFDAEGNDRGTCDNRFDWSWLNAYQGEKPFLVGGGIGYEEGRIAALNSIENPRFAGVNISKQNMIQVKKRTNIQLLSFMNSLKEMKV